MRGSMILAAYALAVLLPALGFLWIPGEAEHGVLFDIGRTAGLTGLALLMMQAVLAGRLKSVEKPFGFDMVIRFHQAMGVLAVFLLAFHPFLLAAGGGGWGLVFSLDVSWDIWVGKGALALVVANVGISAFRERMGLDFQRWRILHDVLGPLILVAIVVHSWVAGDDLENPYYQGLWTLFLVLAAGVFIYHRFVRPAGAARRPWTVTRVEETARKVWTIGMSPPDEEARPGHLPGQFHFLTFQRNRGLPVEEHHFTISSSPTEEEVTSTIKESGDFTATMGETRVGDRVAVQGPFGRFSTALHSEDRKILFIAGGIGITPIRAMLRHMADREEERNVILLFANRTRADIAFRRELDAMAGGEKPRLKVVHLLSEPDEDWEGLSGYVDREVIETHCPDVGGRAVYLCGPPAMAHSVKKALEELGVPSSRLREEKFSF